MDQAHSVYSPKIQCKDDISFFIEQFVYCNHEYGKPPEKRFTEIFEAIKTATTEL